MALAAAGALLLGILIGAVNLWTAAAEPAKCWILCDPRDGHYVHVREKADRNSLSVGRLECGDEIRIDGKTKDGFIHIVSPSFESSGGWVHCGYVSEYRPEIVCENYVCVANRQVACRRWMGGPQISGRLGWLHNGSSLTVLARTEEWCVTSRGYIKSEWLEADPV